MRLRLPTGKTELNWQVKIAASYQACNGRAKKWAGQFQAGNPDLICALHPFGMHLMEVKHVPEFLNPRLIMPNPMRVKQESEARKWIDAGAQVILGVVAGSHEANGSFLCLFPPNVSLLDDRVAVSVRYAPGKGFDMNYLLGRYYECLSQSTPS